MSNKQSRTLIADLPVAEQEITEQEMKKVQGGAKAAEEKKKELEIVPAPPAGELKTKHDTVKNSINNIR